LIELEIYRLKKAALVCVAAAILSVAAFSQVKQSIKNLLREIAI
jgi:hypothetical protein